jgi:hypothetical protein
LRGSPENLKKKMYMASDFYTLSEAAAKLGCNERVLAEKLRAGDVVGHKRLGKWYILHADLVEFIRAGKVSPKAPV